MKIGNGFQCLTIFVKPSILDIWQVSEYTSGSCCLFILVKPQISLKSNVGKMTTGQSTEIKCDAAGDPTPVVQWYKRINGVDKKVRKTDATLELFKVKKEQQGMYICEAKNVAGVTRQNYSLTVLGNYIQNLKNDLQIC